MKAQVLTGTKQEIVARVAQIEGEIHEVIVFVKEPADFVAARSHDIFAEMEPFTASAGGADYSRQSLYTAVEGE